MISRARVSLGRSHLGWLRVLLSEDAVEPPCNGIIPGPDYGKPKRPRLQPA
jgi:hypothetical protein